jgi:Zn-dependent M28 family amino/carboxypeptidase
VSVVRGLATAALAGALLWTPVRAADAPATVARFDGAAALRHVERLVAIGPRPAGSPEGEKARAYIVATLRALRITVDVREFTAETPHGRLRMANVVAALPGRRPDVILIGGHYDTKWFRDIRFVGANDGGSSAGFLLELARRLAARPHEYTYWIVWFDGEEARETWTATDSLYGSRQLAGELQRAHRLPRAMLLVDMIGDRDLGLRREAYSTPWLTELVWSSAARVGHAGAFGEDTQPVEDDHAPFLRAGVPAALLIDFDFPPWHTADDTLDVLLDALPRIEDALARAPAGARP